jgi:DNA gyrase/topoisomerase IV subunit A
LLEGDGFFGNPINTDAAAGRYTKVRITKETKNMIFSNSFLHTKDEEGIWDPFWTEIPVGLGTQITGIAVGYKTTILPRKISDIRQFIAGTRKTIKPYYQNFNGKISKVKGTSKTWLIEGTATVDDFEKSIVVTELPPMMKYKSFLKKISRIVETQGVSVTITNDSTTSIKFKIKLRTKGDREWHAFRKNVVNATKMIVTETPVFIKDGAVIEYDKIEDYLIDFRYRVAEINLRKAEYTSNILSTDLKFNEAKLKYLKFMLEKKRKQKEIDAFLSKFDKSISTRLNNILLRALSNDEIIAVTVLIKELKGQIKQTKKSIKELTKIFNSMDDTANTRKIASSGKSTDLFAGEMTEIDGIEVFVGDEKYDEDDENEEL